MKIAILNESTVWGGLESHAVDLARVFQELGHEVTLVCLVPGIDRLFAERTAGEVRIIGVGAPGPTGARAVLRSIAPDWIVFEKGTLHAGGWLIDLVCRLHGKRYVVIEQLEPPPLPARTSGRHFFGLVPGVGLWWFRWRLGGFARSLLPHRVVCISVAVRDRLKDDYLFPERKLPLIPHGVDTSRFRPDPGARARLRRIWQVDEETVVFGSIRRFIHAKGLDVAIRAFAEVDRLHPGRTLLVLIGDGPERESLGQLADSLGIGARVRIEPYTPAPWKVYPAFDTFVMPSRVEALGVAVIEAMAAGCSVIASRVGGIPEIIPDSGIGILVEPDDVSGLAAAMDCYVRQTPALLRAVGQAARAHVETHFEMRQQYRRIADLLAS
jgi:glycosyltransferase involved in cell wall biosynthesis